ncbi:hypothetical protein XFF6992_370200 [Xanthomonas citri pv. fuscans]|nr:hypothetical protein XFF6992_370200 [Xanthomonas citri pv. fuscans]SOO33923.1 hypothetical protein XFF6994_3290026 [Xanthomonas citri pv. fuscans]
MRIRSENIYVIPLAILSWKLSCGLKIEHADEGACGRSVSGGLEIGQFHFSLKEIKNDSAFKKRLLPKGRVLHCARIVGRLRHIGKRTTGSARNDFHGKLQRQRQSCLHTKRQ